jgi:NitT/TauT family transport system ATP-binding protein
MNELAWADTRLAAVGGTSDVRQATRFASGRDPSPQGEAIASPPAIELESISKLFRTKNGTVLALDDINLTVEAGEFISIIGPSGCGKSTLLTITGGLVLPTSGKTSVFGAEVRRPVTDVGIVFQKDLLLDWRTVLQNVLLQAEMRGMDMEQAKVRARQLLKSVGLGDFENARPWELSGGMRQRVGLCRALLHDASLLLLDEPFGALDALTRDQINLDLERLWSAESRTALLITHSISEAIFLSDRVIVISPRPGRIIADVRIDLDRPRGLHMRKLERYAEYEDHLRRLIMPSSGGESV